MRIVALVLVLVLLAAFAGHGQVTMNADIFTTFEGMTNNAVINNPSLNATTYGATNGSVTWSRNGGGTVYSHLWTTNNPWSVPNFSVSITNGTVNNSGTNVLAWDMGAAEECNLTFPFGSSGTITNLTIWFQFQANINITNAGETSDDLLVTYDPGASSWCVFQLTWDTTIGLVARTHCASNGVTQFGTGFSITTNTPYFGAMNLASNGLYQIQVWNTNGTSVGTDSAVYTPHRSTFEVLVGQDDAETQVGNWVYVDNIGVDYTLAKWPLTPPSQPLPPTPVVMTIPKK